MRHLAALAALTLAASASAFVFEVQNGTVNECGQAAFTWSRGVAPYSIAVISEFDVASTYDVPADQIVEKDGLLNYNLTIPYDAGNRTVFIMSDATGFATGGASGLYTVGPRPNGASCTLRSENIPFYFALEPDTDVLPQCGNVKFSFTPNKNFDIVYPVTITGVIPNGNVLQWNTSSSSTTYHVNIASGVQVIFAAWDAAGNQAGASNLQTIAESSDSSCIDANSPSSTPVQYPQPTKTGTGGTILPPTTTTSSRPAGVITVTAIQTQLAKGAAGLTPGAIVGIVIGAIAGFLLLQALIIWFCCRRQIREYREQRRQKRLRMGSGGDVDLYEGDFGGHNQLPGGGMSMVNGRRVSRSDHDGAGTISPYLLTASPGEARSSMHTLDTHDLYAPHAPFSAQGPNSPRTSNSSAPSSPFNPSVPLTNNDSAPPSPVALTNQNTGTTSTVPRLPSKLQLAMANPDNAMFEDAQPRHTAPAGGFRRHEDAGRLPGHEEPDVEELPPNYNPDWERDSAK